MDEMDEKDGFVYLMKKEKEFMSPMLYIEVNNGIQKIVPGSHGQLQRKEAYNFFRKKIKDKDISSKDKFAINLYLSRFNKLDGPYSVDCSTKNRTQSKKKEYVVLMIIFLREIFEKNLISWEKLNTKYYMHFVHIMANNFIVSFQNNDPSIKEKDKKNEKEEETENISIKKEKDLPNLSENNSKEEDRYYVSKSRRFQAKFSSHVKIRDNFTCLCCGTKIKQTLIGAHIVPYSEDHNNRYIPENGICLCSYCHSLFDTKLITFGTTGEIIQLKTIEDSIALKHINSEIMTNNERKLRLETNGNLKFLEKKNSY